MTDIDSPLQRQFGRAFVVNGDIYYSPNSSRKIHVPQEGDFRSQLENPLEVPKEGHKLRPWRIDHKQLRSPRWWTQSFGFLAFYPLLPTFTTPSFMTLLFDVVPYEYCEQDGYRMDQGILREWQYLDRSLRKTAELLLSEYSLDSSIPIPPSAMGFELNYRTISAFNTAMWKTRGWFVVWMGLISFIIAQAETNGQSTQVDKDNLWRQLLGRHLGQSWVDSIACSTIYEYTDSNERTGTFLKLPQDSNLRKGQPAVKWFVSHRIPVWYRWGRNHAANPSLSEYGPLPEQLQHLSTSPGYELRAPFAPSKESKPWFKFFAVRKRVTSSVDGEVLQRYETGTTHNILVNDADVYVWLIDGSGLYFRKKVAHSHRQFMLNHYTRTQIKYDARSNVFDCCRELAPDEGPEHDKYFAIEDELELDNTEMGSLDDLPTFGQSERPDSPLIYSEPASPSVVQHSPVPDTPSEQSMSQYQEIVQMLRLYFGYTAPIPLEPTQAHLLSLPEQRAFLRTLGIPDRSLVDSKFLTWNGSLCAKEFIGCLASRSSRVISNWDLSRDNREAIVLTERFRDVRKVNTTIGETLYVFDFEGVSAVDWKLAMKSAADALLVCRLDSAWDEIDIAQFLLKHAIPFHTLQDVRSLSLLPSIPRPALTLPECPTNYTFTLEDYHRYRDQCDAVLRHPRGRAALMRGHNLWRLARDNVDWEWVYNGPSGISTDEAAMTIVEWAEGPTRLVDDKLTDAEMLLLCGQYRCCTEHRGQFSLRSWYMPQHKFEGSAHDYGRWTKLSELDFGLLFTDDQGVKTLKRQPHSMTSWHKFSRNSNELRLARGRLEEESRKVIESGQI